MTMDQNHDTPLDHKQSFSEVRTSNVSQKVRHGLDTMEGRQTR